ncbi:MAG: glucose 1-dehydrogenase [Proteobacteria bacterium]|nr:glucose 1-dehydrogenase [Pseudomonadota bacterium]MBU1452450.1 glucose 1-dehydrogenase [Pseudomonadota bacterium]MBU2467717.1 glucose 1-dehydrogenase [Pseudomonadota bacterium]MBU2518269.1 glucose 1-dehydrogenase [Pseudomonadota bacterium]
MPNENNRFSLQNKVSLVTGGGRGIGLGIAEVLAGAGSDLVLVARSESQLNSAAEMIGQRYGREVETISADLSQVGDYGRIVEQTMDRFGRLDVLINNAGSNVRKPFLEFEPEDFDAVMAIQLRGAYFMAQAAARQMAKAGSGKIVNLASLTSKIGVPNISAYGAAKGGIFSLTKSMALELAGKGINVNAVAPGYVRTSMTEAAFNNSDTQEWMLSRIPLKRFGSPEDIGYAALFLACPASDYITGEVIYVDGGWMAG